MSGCERCHDGYRVLSLERPTVYCDCTVGRLAKSMDEDPLDDSKALRWETAKRAARVLAARDRAV